MSVSGFAASVDLGSCKCARAMIGYGFGWVCSSRTNQKVYLPDWVLNTSIACSSPTQTREEYIPIYMYIHPLHPPHDHGSSKCLLQSRNVTQQHIKYTATATTHPSRETHRSQGLKNEARCEPPAPPRLLLRLVCLRLGSALVRFADLFAGRSM